MQSKTNKQTQNLSLSTMDRQMPIKIFKEA